MGRAAKQQTYLSVDEFLDTYGGHIGRHELVDGIVRSMAPASALHSQIQSRMLFALMSHLKKSGKPCEAVVEGAISLRMGARDNLRAPDVIVNCSNKPLGKTFDSPVVIVEVLSPSNEPETWETIRACSTLASVKEILVLSSDKRHAQAFRRAADGTWPPEPETIENSGPVAIKCIDFSVPLADLYAGTVLA